MKRIETREDYIESLKALRHVVYYNGRRVDNVTEHPALRPHIEAVALTYELALRPEHEELMTATSHLAGRKINRFTHIHQCIDDLIKKVQMLRLIAHETGSCFQRCVGFDALNATYMTAYDTDRKYKTDYFERIKRYVIHVQDSNVMVVGGMTDPKGDRSLPPSQQSDPDLFTHVLERWPGGGTALVESMHGAGSPETQKVMYRRLGNLEQKKRWARRIVGID